MSRCLRGRCPRSCDRSQGDHDGQPDFDAGRSRGAFWAVDVLEGAGTGTSYDRFVHFDYKPPRTEDTADVCETARACMPNYLIIRDRVRAFRADPEVKAALEAARVTELASPTVADNKSLDDLRAEQHDNETPPARGMYFERLDQLAMEHLLAAR